jgi:hypothetical protein
MAPSGAIMPSPFPGMDPYLELPTRWGGVHGMFIAVMREMLSRQVRPRFFVDSEDSVYIIRPDDPARPLIRPDLYVAEANAVGAPRRGRGGITEPVVIALPEPITVRYASLIVHDTVDHRVVAVIEIVSPVNKVARSQGRREFMRKRLRVLGSETHWIEIDLLRGGERPREVAGRSDYYAALHRAGSYGDLDGHLEVWFADLRDELPTIAVPLVEPLPDAPLDLQAAVETVYQRYSYDDIIDYAASPPDPPLDADDAAWAAERIRRWQAERR